MLASEILTNADDIADLANSDFMSARQKNRILNENFRQIYQKIVNHGDRYLLKQLEPNEQGKYILPDDYYQLHSITASNGTIQVPRKIIGQSENARGYTIEKDEIVVTGYTDVKIMYYPTPEKLFTGSQEVLRPYYPGVPAREGYPYAPPVEAVHRDARAGREAIYAPAVEAIDSGIETISLTSWGNGASSAIIDNNLCLCGSIGARKEVYNISRVLLTRVIDSTGRIIPVTYFPENPMMVIGLSSSRTARCLGMVDPTITEINADNYVSFFKRYSFPYLANLGLATPNNNAYSNYYAGSYDDDNRLYTTHELSLLEVDMMSNCVRPQSYNKDLLWWWLEFQGGVHVRGTTRQNAIVYRLSHHGENKDTTTWRVLVYDFQSETYRKLIGGVDFDDAKNFVFGELHGELVMNYYTIDGELVARNYNDDDVEWSTLYFDDVKKFANVVKIDDRDYYPTADNKGINVNGVWVGTSTDCVYRVWLGSWCIGTIWQNKFQVFNPQGEKLLEESINNVTYGTHEKFFTVKIADNPVINGAELLYMSALPALPEIDIPAVAPIEEVDLPALPEREEIPAVEGIPAVEEVIDVVDTNLTIRNNLFFDVLAYMTALQYKQKQGADTTEIRAQLEAKLEVFYDTLTEDDFENLRIRNLY